MSKKYLKKSLLLIIPLFICLRNYLLICYYYYYYFVIISPYRRTVKTVLSVVKGYVSADSSNVKSPPPLHALNFLQRFPFCGSDPERIVRRGKEEKKKGKEKKKKKEGK